MDYGKVFKKQREKMGISQREMAKKLGLTPKEGTIVKLCSVAFIPLAYFYKEATTLRDYAYPVSLVGNGSSVMCIDPALPGSEE